jgi:hypothetical protein
MIVLLILLLVLIFGPFGLAAWLWLGLLGVLPTR